MAASTQEVVSQIYGGPMQVVVHKALTFPEDRRAVAALEGAHVALYDVDGMEPLGRFVNHVDNVGAFFGGELVALEGGDHVQFVALVLSLKAG